MRLRHRFVQFNSPADGIPGERHGFERRHESQKPFGIVRVCQAVERLRIVGIDIDGFLEVTLAIDQSLAGHLVQFITSFQVEVVSLEILRAPPDQRLRGSHLAGRMLRQPDPERCDHGLRDLILNREDVGHFAIEAFAPELVAVGDTDQLHRDSHAIPALAHAALQHRRHVQRLADLAHVVVLSAERESRSAGGNAKVH